MSIWAALLYQYLTRCVEAAVWSRCITIPATILRNNITIRCSGASFSKVPTKLFGSISSATIPLYLIILFVFLTLKTCEKISFSKRVDCSLTSSFSDLSKSSPQVIYTAQKIDQKIQRNVCVISEIHHTFLMKSKVFISHMFVFITVAFSSMLSSA